jgi:uncharacterized protein involved in exopolysaccharide biosynthesis
MSEATVPEEVTATDIVIAALRHWRVVAVLPVLGAAVLGASAFVGGREYVASASFVPHRGSSQGAMSSLARQFGVGVPSEVPTQSPDFYKILIQSRAVLEAAAETEFGQAAVNGANMPVPLAALLGVKSESRDGVRRAAAKAIAERLTVSVAFETGIVTISVRTPDPRLSEAIVDRLVDLVGEFNQAAQQRMASEEGRFVSARLDDAERELRSAEETLEQFMKHNRTFQQSPELLFQYDRLQRSVAAHQEVYLHLLRSREQARLDAARDTPVLIVIEAGAGSAEPVSRGLLLRVLVGLCVGVFIAAVTIYARERARSPDKTAELIELLDRVRYDARHPGRWISSGRPDSLDLSARASAGVPGAGASNVPPRADRL